MYPSASLIYSHRSQDPGCHRETATASKSIDYYSLLLFQVGTNNIIKLSLGKIKQGFKALENQVILSFICQSKAAVGAEVAVSCSLILV